VASFTVDLSELNRFEMDLGQVPADVTRQLRPVVAKTGFDVISNAQKIVPVDTGATKNSIGADFDSDGLGFTAGPTTDYSIYLELGTSRMAPRAFMGPSFDRFVPQAVAAAELVLGGILR
jgi:HK97 gp10 family phage protein